MTSTLIKFIETIKISGINPYVDVPKQVINDLECDSKCRVLVQFESIKTSTYRFTKTEKDKERLIAIGRLTNDGWYRTTIMPMKESQMRLFLDSWMRDAMMVNVGDQVEIIIKLDDQPRIVCMPELLEEELQKNQIALRQWRKLTPSRQNEIKVYLNFLKTEKKLIENIEKLIDELIKNGE